MKAFSLCRDDFAWWCGSFRDDADEEDVTMANLRRISSRSTL
jgi:hypothetical protein